LQKRILDLTRKPYRRVGKFRTAAILFYATVAFSVLWQFYFVKDGFNSSAENWWLSDYRCPGMYQFMWIKLFCVELCFCSLTLWLHLSERNAFSRAAFVWALLDTFLFLYDYKTGHYLWVYLVVELIIFVSMKIYTKRLAKTNR